MRILELSRRRKQLCALRLDADPETLEVGDAVRRERRFDDRGYLLLDLQTCQEEGLCVGKSLTEAGLTRLIALSDYNRAKSKALWHLSSRSFGCRELAQKLTPDFGAETAGLVVERLTQLGLLDDEAYAAQLAEKFLEGKKLAPRQAVFEITRKGVDRDLAEAAVYGREPDSKAQILSLLETKYWTAITTEKGVARTVAALARKGYSYGDIRAALSQVTDTLYYEE